MYRNAAFDRSSQGRRRQWYKRIAERMAADLGDRADEAATELQRLLDLGAKAVEFHCFDLAKPIYSDAWERTFAMAEEAGVVLCSHIGDAAGVPYPPNERGSSWAHFSIAPFSVAKYIPQFVFAGTRVGRLRSSAALTSAR